MSRIRKMIIMIMLTIGIVGVTSQLCYALEDTGNSTWNNFINDSRFTDGVSWPFEKAPVLRSYPASGCCAYCCDYVKYCYNINDPRNGAVFYDANEIRPGDVLTVGNPYDGKGHWFICFKRNGNNLYVAEGNGPNGRVRIGWNYTASGVANDPRGFTAGYHFATPANHDPEIYFDGVDVYNGRVHVVGWAYDRDAVAQSIDVHVYLFQNGNPTFIGATTANVSRPDVDSALHIGQFHGFDATFETSVRGAAEVQVAAINVGEGSNKWGEKKNITIPNTGTEMTTGYAREIPDGDYLIVSGGNTETVNYYYMDIEGAAVPAINDTNVSLCGPRTGEPGVYDIWTLKYSNGFYTIKQKGTNMSLDVKGGVRDASANIIVSPFHGGVNQQWAISQKAPNGYRIQSRCSGYSLDVNGGVIANGKNIQQFPNHDGGHQSWVFIPYHPTQPLENGRYILLSALDESMELDVAGDTGNIQDGTNVQIWKDTCASQYNSFDVEKLSNGYYKLTNVASGKVLDSYGAGTTHSATIDVYSSNGTPAQQWAIVKQGVFYYLQPRCSGYAMDIHNGLTTDGTDVIQHPYHGKANQLWKFVKAEYTIKYDANGGSNVPANQVKYYKGTLELSKNKPCRTGYEFLGWSTNSSATKADYLSGGRYTTDEDATLYAVWNNNSNSGGSQTGGDQKTTVEQERNSGGSQTGGDQKTTVEQEPITIKKTPVSVKAKAKKNKVTVSWKKIKKTKKTKKLLTQIKGIQVQYSTDPKFEQNPVTKKVSKSKTKITLKLKKKTTYFIRIRYVGKNGVSKWTKAKRVKTKK